MVQHILNDVDPGVLKTTLVNFFIYGQRRLAKQAAAAAKKK